MAKCGWCNTGHHSACIKGRPIGQRIGCTCDHGADTIEYEYNTPPQGRLANIMANEEDQNIALTLASDGRSTEHFDDLESRRNELAEQFGNRIFSRAAVGAYMGVPGPTIMRIERVTPKTTAVELEELEKALDELQKSATESAEVIAAERAEAAARKEAEKAEKAAAAKAAKEVKAAAKAAAKAAKAADAEDE